MLSRTHQVHLLLTTARTALPHATARKSPSILTPKFRTLTTNLNNNSTSAFAKLSTTELKRMLAERGVDSRDCVEKRDLVEKLEQAIQDNKPVTPAKSASENFTEFEKRVIDVFKRTSKSVAYIQTLVRVAPINFNAMEVPAGTGSGFVWDEHGHIVTNYHVIFPPQQDARQPKTIKVLLHSISQSFDAHVIGTEPDKDLCVLRLSPPLPPSLRAISLSNSSDLVVGQSVLAIGNPFGLDYTLTTGVVSALGREVVGVAGRPIKGCVQTDAAINPGNSGGPLLDSSGRLIGINTMIYSKSGASAGIGFAIPVDTVRRVVTQLIRYGRVIRPSLGVQVLDDNNTRNLLPDIKGVLILEVNPGTPAEKAGLQGTHRDITGRVILGDMITAVDGVGVNQVEDLLSAVEEKEIGTPVKLSIYNPSSGHHRQVSVVLAPRN